MTARAIQFLNTYPYPDFVSIGDWTYGTPPTIESFPAGATITIGKFCCFGSEVTIYNGGEHRTEWITTFPFSAEFLGKGTYTDPAWTRGNVTIGHDVWIGDRALIRSGVTIGSGAVIGMASVVTKNVAPYEIVGGNPLQHLNWRFTRAQRRALLDLAWWDWPIEKIRRHASLLMSSRVPTLLAGVL